MKQVDPPDPCSRGSALKLRQASCDRSTGHPAALQRHHFALSPARAIVEVTKRQITLMLRDTALTRGRFMQVS